MPSSSVAPRGRRRRVRSRRWRPVDSLLAAAIVALVLIPAAAARASPAALIRDCQLNGRIVGHYTQQDYSQALANLPTDVTEYSDCAGVIRRAELAAAGGVTNRSANLPPGSAAAYAAANPRVNPLSSATPSEQAAIAQARRGGSIPVDVGGQLVRPGVIAARTSSILNALPTPLLIALGALCVIVLAVCGRYARDLVRARRPG